MAVSKDHSSIHRKLALVIGNDRYKKSSNRLNFAVNNANDVSNLLKTINFQVTTLNDLDKKSLTNTIIDFAKNINDGDLVLLYYSGHACQSEQKNYFIPIDDSNIEGNGDIEDFSVNIERTILRFTQRNPSYLNIFILDCCKPYLLKNESASNATSESIVLSEIRPPPAAFIQYSCAANQIAEDGVGTDRNSLFTKHLLQNITRENIHFSEMFREVVDNILKENRRKSKPYSANQFCRDEKVYLNQVIIKQPDPSLDGRWDENKEGNLEFIKKAHARVKAYYNNFPTLDDVTNDKRPEMREAREFTKSILNYLPTGNISERNTVCHVLNNLLAKQNLECVFYDSEHGKDLHDSSSILAEIGSNERPFVLNLKSSNGLGGQLAPQTECGNIRLARILTESIQNKKPHPIADDLRKRLSEAHRTDKENIYITSVYVGSFNVAYIVKDWTPEAKKSLPELQKNLEKNFEEFDAAKLHPLLCRPAFDISSFDKQGNKIFSSNVETHQVGPPGRTQLYTSPAGWARYGLKVLGKYSDGDAWLHPFRDPGNWYRAFHGTGRSKADDFSKSKQSYDKDYACVDAMGSIYKTGFRKARVAAYGSGVYCSPDPTFPERGYVGTVECDTQQGKKKFKCMLQVAVNPDGVTFTSDQAIWVVPEPEDIRPYGILIKEV